MKLPEPHRASPPVPPAGAPAPALPPRSEALEAELAALEAMLPPDTASAQEPASDAAAGEGTAGVS